MNDRRSALRIGYLTTKYPSISHTFIQGEILALESMGYEIERMSINRCSASELLTDLDRQEATATFAIKGQRKLTLARTLLRAIARHPIAVGRGIAIALRRGAPVGTVVKSTLHFLEGIVVWDWCRRRDTKAVHAHFGQAPASIAEAAAWFGNAVDRHGSWSWSVTIHGWHEFANEDTAHLAAKLTNADLIVAISNFTRSQLMRIVDPEAWPRIELIRCGIDLTAFPARSEPAAGTPPVALMVARLSPEKGHVVLLEAIAALRVQGFDLRTLLVGAGPMHDRLDRLISELGISDLVELMGPLAPAEVAQALQDADVFVLPTFAEGLPVSIMEAMASRVPVVTTFIAGIPELVIDGLTGWTVPAGSSEHLALALRDAVRSRSAPERTSAGYDLVAEQHDRRQNVFLLAAALRSAHGSAPGADQGCG